MTGWCAPHTPPRFLLQNTFFLQHWWWGGVNLTRRPVSSRKAPFFCSADDGAVWTSHAAPFSLAKHFLQHRWWGGVHLTCRPVFSPETHVFCSINDGAMDRAVYKNGSRLNTSIYYDCISVVWILLLFIIILWMVWSKIKHTFAWCLWAK